MFSASSKIEGIATGMRDYFRALHGNRSDAAAVSMANATGAVDQLVGEVDRTGVIALRPILEAHRVLMRDDRHESAYAGRVRDVQNWIAGSDHSPRGALFVPPPPETVPEYLDDLLVLANRTDLPAFVVAGLAHAQFESVHPFTDGNGRIGRALINSILRRRRVIRQVVVPIASALVARRDEYFAHLDAYRAGDGAPIVEALTRATLVAATEARVTAGRLRVMPEEWVGMLGRVRRGSGPHALLARLVTEPVITADDATRLLGVAPSAAYSALDRLVEAGVLVPLTDRKRDQVWGAADVLDELDDLNRRIGERAVTGADQASWRGGRAEGPPIWSRTGEWR